MGLNAVRHKGPMRIGKHKLRRIMGSKDHIQQHELQLLPPLPDLLNRERWQEFLVSVPVRRLGSAHGQCRYKEDTGSARRSAKHRQCGHNQ